MENMFIKKKKIIHLSLLAMFLKHGVEECGIFPFMLEKEVRLVKAGEEFFNGNIKVIDKKILKVKAVKVLNRKEDNKGCTLSHNGYEEFEKVINF